jgi:hypothetical protein
VDPGFFYETVAPLMIVGNTSLLAISTLTSEINFYTRLIKMRDQSTGLPMFVTLCIELACSQCKEDGKATDCVHLLHLVPRWQSSERHVRLKTIMQDRPDLIISELSGLAFDSLQQAFRPNDIAAVMKACQVLAIVDEPIYISIDPAAGGAQSDYTVVSFIRQKGVVTVSFALPQPSLMCGRHLAFLTYQIEIFECLYQR